MDGQGHYAEAERLLELGQVAVAGVHATLAMAAAYISGDPTPVDTAPVAREPAPVSATPTTEPAPTETAPRAAPAPAETAPAPVGADGRQLSEPAATTPEEGSPEAAPPG